MLLRSWACFYNMGTVHETLGAFLKLGRGSKMASLTPPTNSDFSVAPLPVCVQQCWHWVPGLRQCTAPGAFEVEIIRQ